MEFEKNGYIGSITVSLKNVYGNELIYPVCEKAKLFASLTGKKTLSQNDIDVIIKALGFEIYIEQKKKNYKEEEMKNLSLLFLVFFGSCALDKIRNYYDAKEREVVEMRKNCTRSAQECDDEMNFRLDVIKRQRITDLEIEKSKWGNQNYNYYPSRPTNFYIPQQAPYKINPIK